MNNWTRLLLEENVAAPLEGCVFCGVPQERILRETESFVILLDPFPLMQGHFLIISKEHWGCAGELPEAQLAELEQLKSEIRASMEKKFGVVSFYEHGRAGHCMKSKSGERICHHFHLHALPFAGDLASELQERFVAYPTDSVGKLSELYLRYGDYLYFESASKNAAYYPVRDGLESHYLRTLIARKLGRPELADWEAYPKSAETRIWIEYAKIMHKNLL